MRRNFTLGEIYSSIPAWRELSNIPKPPRLSYRCGKMFSKLNDIYTRVEKARNEIIKQLGTPVYYVDEDGQKTDQISTYEIANGSSASKAYFLSFDELCCETEELELIDMPFDDFISALGDDVKVSDACLICIERFFSS